LVVVETRPHPKIDCSTTVRRSASKHRDWGSLSDNQTEVVTRRLFQFSQRGAWTSDTEGAPSGNLDMPQHLRLFLPRNCRRNITPYIGRLRQRKRPPSLNLSAVPTTAHVL